MQVGCTKRLIIKFYIDEYRIGRNFAESCLRGQIVSTFRLYPPYVGRRPHLGRRPRCKIRLLISFSVCTKDELKLKVYQYLNNEI